MRDDQRAALETVQATRRVARYVVRSLDGDDRSAALHRLLMRAKTGEAPKLAADALVGEVADWALFGDELDDPMRAADPVIRAIGKLHRRGLVRCDRCERPLPTRAELYGWMELERRAIDEVAIRGRAPYREVDG